jgi:hypothetical protein
MSLNAIYSYRHAPMHPYLSEMAGTFEDELDRSTFRLIKLHGSINWFYSGGEQFPGEQIYFREVDSDVSS